MTTSDYHLVGADGRPFFWLADTAWNLWCKGTPDEWDEYLAWRKGQGFTAIQFVAGWWRGSMQPIHGRPFDVVDGRLVFDEAAWRSLDALFELIRSHGLIASPIMLWTLTDIDPGQVLSEEQCVEVARRQLERWDAPDVVWLLGGDGNYTSAEAEARWKRIGRAVFGQSKAMSTLHPCGGTWVAPAFAAEPWYKIATIQSGHGSVDSDLQFLVNGGYSQDWRKLEMPHLNLEPNYEDARSYGVRLHLTDYHVRRASYWSMLVAPPAGVTYGIGSVWMWSRENGEIAENHDSSWVGRPWREDMDAPGALQMKVLKEVFLSLPWTRLRPAPELLAKQPGLDDPNLWQAVASTHERDCVLAYLPQGGKIELDTPEDLRWSWIEPKTGEMSPATSFEAPQGPTSDALLLGLRR